MFDGLRRMNATSRNTLASVFLIIAGILASITYARSFLWLFSREVSFLPDLASALLALFLVLPVVRGDFLYTHRLDLHTAVNLFLIFYLTAAFATMGLGEATLAFKGPTFVLAVIVVALANLNAARYGELAVIALAVFGGMNVFAASEAMGFNGFLLVISSAMGVLLAVDLQKVAKTLVGQPRAGL